MLEVHVGTMLVCTMQSVIGELRGGALQRTDPELKTSSTKVMVECQSSWMEITSVPHW